MNCPICQLSMTLIKINNKDERFRCESNKQHYCVYYLNGLTWWVQHNNMEIEYDHLFGCSLIVNDESGIEHYYRIDYNVSFQDAPKLLKLKAFL